MPKAPKKTAVQLTPKPIALIVTTAHKGVFFGYGHLTTEKTIRLTQAQMCVYWSSDVHGITGLAAHGPSKTCRIGPPAPAITLHDITSIMEASAEASTKWEAAPWS